MLSLGGEVFSQESEKKGRKLEDYQTHHNFQLWNEGKVERWLLRGKRGREGGV